MKDGRIRHVQSLSKRQKIFFVNFYNKLCEVSLEEFITRFANFRKIETELKLFSDPFSFNYVKAPVKYQLELIELQRQTSLKTS